MHGGTELLMLLAIADFADDDGNAYPSVAKLAQKCRMKPRNANYILKALQDSRELEVRIGAGPSGKNRYRINLALLGLQQGAGLQPIAGVQPIASPPATQCAKPLQPIAAEPSVKRQHPSGTLPDWVPAENWQAWIEFRRKIRKPLTDKAKELAVKKLDELRVQGNDPAQVLDQSVLNGWQGLFEIKAGNKGVTASVSPWEGAR